MTRVEYQNHFIKSRGARWRSISAERKKLEWDEDMEHRRRVGLQIFPNPWEDAPCDIFIGVDLARGHDTHGQRPVLIKMKPPRYDDVFWDGLEWLEELD